MKTRIIDNGLENANQSRDIIRALAGTWGVTEGDSQARLDMGRMSFDLVFSGVTLKNQGPNCALAVAVFTDGTSQILAVESGENVTTEKHIKLAIMLARS